MEWLSEFTQHTLFPGQYIYKVSNFIFNEWSIMKVYVLDVKFDLKGLCTFNYHSYDKHLYSFWDRNSPLTEEDLFFRSKQDAVNWCEKNSKVFTIYED
jgi:hypothetical protein